MDTNFEWMKFRVNERIDSYYQEADAYRLANTASKNGRIRFDWLKGTGQVLGRVSQAVLVVLTRSSKQRPVVQES
jgi:hypothetical protein